MPAPNSDPVIEIAVLAGGVSSRMGRDKARIQLQGKTLLGHVLAVAAKLGHRVRVVRRDAVQRCGPLGGIYTAFKRSKADAILFLACDMPFVTETCLRRIVQRHRVSSAAVFARGDKPGFPCLMHRDSLPILCRQMARSRLSLQSLAKALDARMIRPPNSRHQLLNLNTPGDLDMLRRQRPTG